MNLLKSLTNMFGKKKTESNAELVLDESPKLLRGSKLDEEQQLEFVHLIAQGLTPAQCAERLYKSTGIKVAGSLYHVYIKTKKWKDKISELKEQYQNRIDLIDSSHKSVRLRRVDVIMDKAIEKGDLRVALSANEQIRKEFQQEDGQTVVYWNNPVYQQFNKLSNDELIERHKQATAKLRSANGPVRTAEEDKK